MRTPSGMVIGAAPGVRPRESERWTGPGLWLALGVGLATVIRGRNPLTDGFGMIAFASLLPMLFVMGYGIILF